MYDTGLYLKQVEITLKCGTCGQELKAETNKKGEILISICETCLTVERQISYDEGYDKGKADYHE